MTIPPWWWDPEPPHPDLCDVEQAVAHLVNGRDLDGHAYSREELDRVHYPTDPLLPPWTLRECLSETAAELVDRFELDRKRVPKPAELTCVACGKPSGIHDWCPTCEQDDARTFAADRPAPSYSPGAAP